MRGFFFLLLTIASPALAQRTERQGDSYGEPANTVENRIDRVLAQFAFCADSSSSGLVNKVLETPLASDAEAVAVRKLSSARRECIAVYPLPFSPTAVRNALATFVYRRDHRSNGPRVLPAGTKPPANFEVAPVGVNGTEAQQAVWFLGAVAKCVVFADPSSVHRMITGPIDVPEEGKRFEVLAPALTRCVPPNAPKLSARVLRGFLADALLAQVGGPSGKKG